jgi:hypothetical protein
LTALVMKYWERSRASSSNEDEAHEQLSAATHEWLTTLVFVSSGSLTDHHETGRARARANDHALARQVQGARLAVGQLG